MRGCPGGDRLAGQRLPPGRLRRGGGVGAGGEQGGDLTAVQHRHLEVGAGQQPGGLAGPLERPAGGGAAAGPAGAVAGLADDQQRLPGEDVPLGGQAFEETGVLQRGLLQGRVGQARGGLAERGDGGGQVGPTGPDQDLHRAGERVQPPPIGRGEGVLLGRAPQREVHSRHRRHGGGPVGVQADHPVGGDAPPQRGQHGRGRGLRGRGCGPAGRGRDALRCGDQLAGGAGLPPGGGQQPVQGQAVALPGDQRGGGDRDRGGERGVGGQRHDPAGGQPPGPDGQGRDGGDRGLAGGQPGEDLVGHVDVGGDRDGLGNFVAHQNSASGRGPGSSRPG